MSMQTITVNGIKISYNSNVKKKSTESNIPLADDGLSLMIQATEAYVESGYQIKALEAIGAFSTEAAPGFVKKIGGGIKAVIEKIKEFFIKIGQYIKRMFLSNAYNSKASSVYNKLIKNGVREDWKTIQVSGCGNIDLGFKVLDNTSKPILDLLSQLQRGEAKYAMVSFKGVYNKIDESLISYTNTITNESTNVSELITDMNNFMRRFKSVAISYRNSIGKQFIDLHKVSDECVKMCNRLSSIEDPDEDTRNKLNQLRQIERVTSLSIKAYSSICASLLAIGNAITAKSGEEKYDYKNDKEREDRERKEREDRERKEREDRERKHYEQMWAKSQQGMKDTFDAIDNIDPNTPAAKFLKEALTDMW